MPVITLTLTWHPQPTLPSYQAGWDFEIAGRSELIDMKSHKFVRMNGPPYRMEGYGPNRKLIGEGPAVWVLTADEEPLLGKNKGATWDKVPMGFVARFLEALEGKGYHVASQSAVEAKEYSAPVVTHVWTLKYCPPPTSPSSQITA